MIRRGNVEGRIKKFRGVLHKFTELMETRIKGVVLGEQAPGNEDLFYGNTYRR